MFDCEVFQSETNSDNSFVNKKISESNECHNLSDSETKTSFSSQSTQSKEELFEHTNNGISNNKLIKIGLIISLVVLFASFVINAHSNQEFDNNKEWQSMVDKKIEINSEYMHQLIEQKLIYESTVSCGTYSCTQLTFVSIILIIITTLFVLFSSIKSKLSRVESELAFNKFKFELINSYNERKLNDKINSTKNELSKDLKVKIVELETSLPQSLSPILIKLNDVESCVKQINAKDINKDLENTNKELLKAKSDFEIMKNEFTKQLTLKDEENSKLVFKISEFESKLEKLRNEYESNVEITKQELKENTTRMQKLIKANSDLEITKNEFTKQLAFKDEEIVELKEKQLDFTIDNDIVIYEWDSTNHKHIKVHKIVDANTSIGSIASFCYEIPNGWIKSNGTHRNRDQFPKLFSVIGCKYGSVDGCKTFCLPNFTESSQYRHLFIKAI